MPYYLIITSSPVAPILKSSFIPFETTWSAPGFLSYTEMCCFIDFECLLRYLEINLTVECAQWIEDIRMSLKLRCLNTVESVLWRYTFTCHWSLMSKMFGPVGYTWRFKEFLLRRNDSCQRKKIDSRNVPIRFFFITFIFDRWHLSNINEKFNS